MSSTAGTHAANTPDTGQGRGRARDYRLDFFRGLALMFIFIDHVPDNVAAYFTLRSFAFCDAAEVFIFISGYTAALAYGPVFDREGVAMGIARIYRRVWQLYVAHICLFTIFNAEIAYTMKFYQNPMFSDELQVGDYLDNMGEAFIRVLLLQFQPSLLNILPLYIALLIVLPFFLLCIRRHVLLGLIPSAALYAAVQVTGWNMPGFPAGRLWFFDPFAWQFLFAIAASMGFAYARGGVLVRLPRWAPVAASIFAVVAAVLSANWNLHDAVPWIPVLVTLPDAWFEKTLLPPARVASILALAIAVGAYIPRDGRFMLSPLGRLAIICGQNSLHVFCLGILMSALANAVLNVVGHGLAAQLAANVAGIAAMIAMGLGLAWFKAGGHMPSLFRAKGTA